jgi:hypothetical protein
VTCFPARRARWPLGLLGACNPPLAHQALTADDKIGTMLPCNVIVQDLGGGQIEPPSTRKYPWSMLEIRRLKRSPNPSPASSGALSPQSNNVVVGKTKGRR